MIISRLVTLFYCWFYMISTPVALAFAPVEDGTGEISGKVLDAETGEELIGATVVIKGTQNGSITGLSGDSYLSGVEEGNQTLVVSFVGYATSEIAVKIQQGILVNVTVQLQSSTTQLDEIVVVAKADIRYSPIRNSTDIQLVNAIKYSEGIITGISNEQIIKSVDRDASQIAQRISGVSLVDRFVVIRGLDTRYNLTLINGIVAPSSEDNSRAFSYDALPTGVIDRMELEKSPAPHLPAMWGGGIMKIYTRNFAKAPFHSALNRFSHLRKAFGSPFASSKEYAVTIEPESPKRPPIHTPNSARARPTAKTATQLAAMGNNHHLRSPVPYARSTENAAIETVAPQNRRSEFKWNPRETK